MSRSRSIFNRLYGVPPGRDAPKLDRLLWFRGYYLRSLVLAALPIVFVVVFLPAWIAVVVMLPWLIGFARLSAEIRGERRRR
jgi:ABC-type transport system involved in multi-copper enzyme maturation permease subunit